MFYYMAVYGSGDRTHSRSKAMSILLNHHSLEKNDSTQQSKPEWNALNARDYLRLFRVLTDHEELDCYKPVTA